MVELYRGTEERSIVLPMIEISARIAVPELLLNCEQTIRTVAELQVVRQAKCIARLMDFAPNFPELSELVEKIFRETQSEMSEDMVQELIAYGRPVMSCDNLIVDLIELAGIDQWTDCFADVVACICTQQPNEGEASTSE